MLQEKLNDSFSEACPTLIKFLRGNHKLQAMNELSIFILAFNSKFCFLIFSYVSFSSERSKVIFIKNPKTIAKNR